MRLVINIDDEEINKEIRLAVNNYLENQGIMGHIREVIGKKVEEKMKSYKLRNVYAKVIGMSSTINKVKENVNEIKEHINKRDPYAKL